MAKNIFLHINLKHSLYNVLKFTCKLLGRVVEFLEDTYPNTVICPPLHKKVGPEKKIQNKKIIDEEK